MNTPYVKWLIANHQEHHNHTNSNFNIVFPGADYLFGTYNLNDLQIASSKEPTASSGIAN